MAKQYSIALVFILLIQINCKAQSNDTFFDVTGGGGTYIPNYPALKNLPVSFFNARIGIKTFGQKEWQRVYNNPEIGVGLSHTNLDKGFVGNPTAVYSFMNLPLVPNSILKLDLGMHLGFAWGFNPYSEHNLENLAIGSKCSAYISLNLNTSFKISQNLELLLLAGGYHYSNGNMNKPNKGINMLGAETGLRYKLSKTMHEPVREAVTPLQKNSSVIIFGAWGLKKENTNGPLYTMGTLSTGYYLTVSHKNRLSAGLDLFYDDGALFYSKYANQLKNVMAAGFFGGHELTFDKFSIVTQVGLYLRNPNPQDKPYYERCGVRYIIAKRIIPSITIKAHDFKADFIEWGLGYVLWKTSG